MHSSKHLGLFLAIVLLSCGKMSSGALFDPSPEVISSSEFTGGKMSMGDSIDNGLVGSLEPDYRIFLVRHGNTKANTLGIMQGFKDEEDDEIYKLDKQGIEEAKEVAKKLSHYQIHQIISCPLSRAYETAKEINQNHKLEIWRNEELKGLRFGEWEGKQVRILKLNENLGWERNEELIQRVKMERKSDYEERVIGFFENYLNENLMKDLNLKKNVIIVTHQWPIKDIVNFIIKEKEAMMEDGIDLEKDQLGGSLTEIQVWLAGQEKKARYYVKRFGEKADEKVLD
ncbi:histidine phosphatase superfamily [Melampsora americana]|nr:histidine phosphatase superfamily [Melampsora americana]